MPVDVELVELSTLSVAEGDNVPVTTAHVNVVLDYVKYGVRDTGVLIRVLQPPSHGKLIAEVWERGSAATPGGSQGTLFTLLDLAKDKVRANIRGFYESGSYKASPSQSRVIL